MTRKLLLFGLLFFVVVMQAQQEGNLNFQRNIWQANRTNPAFLPAAQFTIGLPSIYNNLLLENTNLENLVNRTNNRIQLDNIIDGLGEDNVFRTYLDLETISGGLYLGDVHLSLHHAFKVNAFADFPKELAQVIGQGNAQFVGETVDLSHDANVFSYSELGLGVGWKINDNFSVGGRMKYLNGIGDFSVNRGNLFLTTSDDIYQLTLNADYQLNASSLIEYNGLSNPESVVNLRSVEIGKVFTSNQGLAFDIGANLQFDDLDIGLSILDIGGINWKENVRNYNANGAFEYGGLDLVNAYLQDSVSFSTVLDSLEQVFDVAKNRNGYSTTLPRKLYASFNYQFNDTWTGGIGLYGEWYRSDFLPALNLNANAQLTDFLSLGANYTLLSKQFNALGVNAQLRVGPVQLYAMTNYLPSAIRCRKSSNVDFRVGANLLFGRE